jgi:hypothetical protein
VKARLVMRRRAVVERIRRDSALERTVRCRVYKTTMRVRKSRGTGVWDREIDFAGRENTMGIFGRGVWTRGLQRILVELGQGKRNCQDCHVQAHH